MKERRFFVSILIKKLLLSLLILATLSGILGLYGCKYSKDLVYFPINGGEEYEVIGMGECDDIRIIIPETYKGKKVTSIGMSAFAGQRGIGSVKLPSTITNIEPSAFYGCTFLTNIEMSPNIKSIGGSAFFECSALKKIEIPKEVTEIKNQTFTKCEKLEKVTFAEGSKLSVIDREAFMWCRGLKEIEIPDSVHTIEYQAFSACTSLRSIRIPIGVTKMGYDVFSGCKDVIIYCERENDYCEGWSKGWNQYGCAVFWGCKE